MKSTNANLKRERFEKIASKRVQKIILDLESLSKCSNKNNYEFFEKDVKKMMQVIRDKVRILELSFSKKQTSDDATFKF